MKKISKGYKRFLRSEKARIRREVLDPQEQKKQIEDLYAGFSEKENIND